MKTNVSSLIDKNVVAYGIMDKIYVLCNFFLILLVNDEGERTVFSNTSLLLLTYLAYR